MSDELSADAQARRQVLVGLGKAVLTLTVLPACGAAPGMPGAKDAGCTGTHGNATDGWVSVALSDYPAPQQAGGWAVVHEPLKLLDVIVVRTPDACFAAVWRICTHGACEASYSPADARVECPCHGSQFGLDGSVLRGPATRPLTAFVAVRDGDLLWLHRSG